MRHRTSFVLLALLASRPVTAQQQCVSYQFDVLKAPRFNFEGVSASNQPGTSAIECENRRDALIRAAEKHIANLEAERDQVFKARLAAEANWRKNTQDSQLRKAMEDARREEDRTSSNSRSARDAVFQFRIGAPCVCVEEAPRAARAVPSAAAPKEPSSATTVVVPPAKPSTSREGAGATPRQKPPQTSPPKTPAGRPPDSPQPRTVPPTSESPRHAPTKEPPRPTATAIPNPPVAQPEIAERDEPAQGDVEFLRRVEKQRAADEARAIIAAADPYGGTTRRRSSSSEPGLVNPSGRADYTPAVDVLAAGIVDAKSLIAVNLRTATNELRGVELRRLQQQTQALGAILDGMEQTTTALKYAAVIANGATTSPREQHQAVADLAGKLFEDAARTAAARAERPITVVVTQLFGKQAAAALVSGPAGVAAAVAWDVFTPTRAGRDATEIIRDTSGNESLEDKQRALTLQWIGYQKVVKAGHGSNVALREILENARIVQQEAMRKGR